MNGFKMISDKETNSINYETFSAPANLVLPDSVGKLVIFVIIKSDLLYSKI